MAMQNQLDNSTRPFILYNYPANRRKVTIKQDATRATELAPYTLLAKIASTGLYVPLTDVEATDGSALPAAIYVGEPITAAALVAGNVTDCPVITSGIRFDEDQLVLENDVDLDDVIGPALDYTAGVYTPGGMTTAVFDAGTSDATYTPAVFTPGSYVPGTATLAGADVRTIRDHLESRMLVAVDTDAASAYEA